MSKTRLQRLLGEMDEACNAYIAGEFIQTLRTRYQQLIGTSSAWALEIGSEPHIILFRYPQSVTKDSYLRAQVMLEMGTQAAFEPQSKGTICPFVAEQFPDRFEEAECSVSAINPERTFWEKATILHQEFHRPEDKRLPKAYARHYYDVAMLAQHGLAEQALADLPLLGSVVAHKERFWPRSWARYDLAVPATLALSPSPFWEADLKRDYEDMKVMLYGEAPGFEKIPAVVAH